MENLTFSNTLFQILAHKTENIKIICPILIYLYQSYVLNIIYDFSVHPFFHFCVIVQFMLQTRNVHVRFRTTTILKRPPLTPPKQWFFSENLIAQQIKSFWPHRILINPKYTSKYIIVHGGEGEFPIYLCTWLSENLLKIVQKIVHFSYFFLSKWIISLKIVLKCINSTCISIKIKKCFK